MKELPGRIAACIIISEAGNMMDKETRLRLARQLDEMKKRMATEASDLDYETQRYAIRSLERILEKDLSAADKKGT